MSISPSASRLTGSKGDYHIVVAMPRGCKNGYCTKD